MTEPHHRITNVVADGNIGTGTCSVCGDGVKVKRPATRNYWYCWVRRTESEKLRRKNPAVRKKLYEAQDRYKSRQRGLTRAAAVESAGYACEICSTPLTIRTARIDHDHACCPANSGCAMCYRGVLCNRCNTGIGMLGDTIEGVGRAHEYLRTRSLSERSESLWPSARRPVI